MTAREDAAALLGRVLMSLIFIQGGIAKMGAAAAVTAMIAKAGLPAPDLAYVVAVCIELGLGLALLLGLFARLSGLVLAVFCAVTAAYFHSNWADHNMQIHFWKNVAMAGGFLYVAGFGAGRFSLDALMPRRATVARA